MLKAKRIHPILVLALLAACGGGGNGGSTTDSNGSDPQTGSSGSPSSTQSTWAQGHHRCGWIEAGNTDGEKSFIQNASFFDEIHPYWWTLSADGTHINPARQGVDTPGVVAAAHANHVRLMPLIFFESADGVRAMMNDPQLRSNHVQELLRLATDHNYDGMEIDYESLFQASDRPGYSAFVAELAKAFHGAGKQVSVAVPGITLTGETLDAYDYVLLGSTVDRVHIMGYDFHGVTSDHSGPIAPLGWLKAIFENVARSKHPEVFVLGIANYSVSPGKYYVGADAVRLCGGTGAYSSQTDHMASCPIGHYDAGLSPHCVIGGVDTYFEDPSSIAEKLRAAKAAGLGGVAYYSLGGEEAGWLDTLEQYY